MLTITIVDYDEGGDLFNCQVTDDSGATFPAPVGAFLMPYIAPDAYDPDDTEPPFGLIGKTFELRTPELLGE